MRSRLPILIVLLWLTSLALWGQKLRESDFTPARECGRCHEEIYLQWTQSMHARSLTDPLYRAVVEKAMEGSGGRLKTFCLSCHAPVAGVSGSLSDLPLPLDWDRFSPLALEGVTCDFCHTISGEERLGRNISVGAYVYPRQGLTAVKYGRHADAENEAHAVRPSRFLIDPEFCAICHKFMHPVGGREVQNTYQEWLEGPYSKKGIRCQDCHMPAFQGRSAPEGKLRRKVHAHFFAGGRGALAQQAATLSIEAVQRPRQGGVTAALEVRIKVRNSGAGHTIPTGLPGLRQIVLEVEALDGEGDLLGRQRFRYGQRLLGKDGQEVLLWEPFERLEDTRIAPEQERLERFEIPLPAGIKGPVTVRAWLLLHLLVENLGRRLGLLIPDPIPMTRTELRVQLEP